jgi:hypothetical protein
MAVKYTNILHSKAFQSLPKVGFLVYHLATLPKSEQSPNGRQFAESGHPADRLQKQWELQLAFH